MQISHILNKEFVPERFETLSVVALWILSIGSRLAGTSNANYLAIAAMAASMFDCLSFLVVLARRMAMMLGIGVFAYNEHKKIK